MKRTKPKGISRQKRAEVKIVDVTTEIAKAESAGISYQDEKACRALCHLQPPIAVAAAGTQSLMAWLVEVASLIVTVILNGIHVDRGGIRIIVRPGTRNRG